MKQTVSASDFIDAFSAHNRQEQFSYDGLHALFEYLEELESDTGTEMELDVVAICCDFSEYASAKEAAEEHGWEADADTDEEENEEAAIYSLRDRTQVIPHGSGVIISAF